MAKLLIVGTKRYSINMCDYDLMFRNSKHEIVQVLYHKSISTKRWFNHPNRISCPGNRDGVLTRLLDHSCQSWDQLSYLKYQIEKTDCDYICLGNGHDNAGIWLQSNFPDKKFLFSEYGWLPWRKCFYIDDKGVGPKSSLRYMDINKMKSDINQLDEIKDIQDDMKGGESIPYNDFLYVPLQVDTPTSDGKPDFKFRFTGFKNNKEFLNALRKIIPSNIKLLVKSHPAAKKPTPVPDGMIDITNIKFDKYELYSKMKAMVVINSTSVLEAMMFNKPIFTYGQDIFSAKQLTYEQVKSQDKFMQLLRDDPDYEGYKKFLSTLLSRQFYRHRWQNKKYVDSHYWNQSL